MKGNEEVDILAKEGDNTHFPGPKPFCGLSKSYIKEELRQSKPNQLKRYWDNARGYRKAKRFTSQSLKTPQQLLDLNKKEFRLVKGLFTGHCQLKYHLLRSADETVIAVVPAQNNCFAKA